MSDDTAQAGHGDDSQATENGAEGFTPITTQEEFDQAIQKRIAREKSKTADVQKNLDEALGRLSDLEDTKPTIDKQDQELASLRDQVEKLSKDAADKDRALIVERVSTARNVPAKYLSGDSEQELDASADEFWADIEPLTAPKGAAHVPTSGTGGEKPVPKSVGTGRERARAVNNGS